MSIGGITDLVKIFEEFLVSWIEIGVGWVGGYI